MWLEFRRAAKAALPKQGRRFQRITGVRIRSGPGRCDYNVTIILAFRIARSSASRVRQSPALQVRGVGSGHAFREPVARLGNQLLFALERQLADQHAQVRRKTK